MLNPSKKQGDTVRHVLATTIGMMALIGSLLAQSSGNRSAFEVASLKPNRSGESTTPGGFFQPGGRYLAANVSLNYLVLAAYNLRLRQLSGGPNWVSEDKYDMEAKAPEGVISGGPLDRAKVDQMRLMLQAFLVERFKLKVHKEVRESPIFALVVAKGGPKLTKANRDCTVIADVASEKCHSFGGGGRISLTAQSIDMADLADYLSFSYSAGQRPVINATGLSGLFDIALNWTLDTEDGIPDDARGPRPANGNPQEPKGQPNGPGFYQALEQQLGLKLESRTGLVEFTVIDSAQKPTEN
jgi:bla regulator protein blaR1